jgi:hypothetical protein
VRLRILAIREKNPKTTTRLDNTEDAAVEAYKLFHTGRCISPKYVDK